MEGLILRLRGEDLGIELMSNADGTECYLLKDAKRLSFAEVHQMFQVPKSQVEWFLFGWENAKKKKKTPLAIPADKIQVGTRLMGLVGFANQYHLDKNNKEAKKNG